MANPPMLSDGFRVRVGILAAVTALLLAYTFWRINTSREPLHHGTCGTEWRGNHKPTAVCADRTPSFSMTEQGTCSHHGGVACWVEELPQERDVER
jgi:hypothetical protein